ncbi:4Fe-4S double cluster binding domain-containing protein [Parabacteroides sp. FAFU027]|uniref:4Fe-4S double cluster binding domain-containing protein n=1 Tax=Parabacteroides sp. FAFU027 TaxID=2922715 RepID=UPI001FAFA289|nr:hypothetical protein [Parabacteroides sp. FAFU027]
MITSNDIKKYAFDQGADLCGIASIDRFDDFPKGFHPKDVYKETQSVISIVCKIPEMPLYIDTPSPYTAIEEIALTKVSQIAFAITNYIEKKGYSAILIPSVPYDYWDADTLTGKGILSLKHIGYKAGIGRIGKNALLCNEKYGNLIKLGAIITNAVLESDDLIDKEYCNEKCRLCIDSCPVNAIDENYHVSQKKCREYSEIKNKRGVEIYSCKECRKVCPNGSRLRK